MKSLIGPIAILTLGCAAMLRGQAPVIIQNLGPGSRVAPPGPPVAETKPEDLCGIEGRIVNAASGEPVRKANLTLRRADITSSTTGPPTNYTTSSDDAGQFAMKGIEPGRYRLMVMRAGFVMTEYGARGPQRPGATLTLAPGQKASSIDFKLIPHAVIAGRVLDEDGEPLPYVQVSPMRWRFAQGRRQLMPQGGSSSNDLGEFRIFGLPPGRYYLGATHNNRMMFESAVDSSARQAPDEGYVPTYYPGTTDPASAVTLDVVAGQQLTGMEIRLSKARTVRIRGRVNNLTGVTGRGPVMVMLTPRNGMGYSMNRTMASSPQNQFEFRGVAPGSYILTANLPIDRNMISARVPIEVGNAHLENVEITVKPGAELRGELKLDGVATSPVNLTQIMVVMGPAEQGGMMFGPSPNGRVNEDGTFVLTNVNPERYWVMVRGLPDGYYVKAVRMSDQDGLENGLDMTAGASGVLQIVVGSGAGQVEGAVMNSKQEPVSGATVVLLPDNELRRQQMQFVKMATTDQFGRYTLKNVDPGEYRLYGWEDIESGQWLDPDFIKPLESKGKKITLREGSRETAELTAIQVE